MATGIAATLVYLGAAEATATAVAATTVAIASSVAYGAVVGAVVGAGTAAIAGGDIGKGALTGAVIGGVTAGIGEGISAYAAPVTSAAPATTPAIEAGTTISGSLEPVAETGLLGGSTQLPNYALESGRIANAANIGNQVATSNTGLLSSTIPATTAADAAKNAASSRFWAGVGQGAATAAGTVYAEKMKEDAAEEVIKKQEEKMNAFKGGTATEPTNFTRPKRWDRRYASS